MKNIKKAIFPGSFDPITLGHIDIIKKSLAVFDEVIIAVGVNSSKKNLFSTEQKMYQIKHIFADNKSVKVVSYEGLLVDLVKNYDNPTVVRGIRNVNDFTYEKDFFFINNELMPEIEFVYLISRKEYTATSSSFVREIASMGGCVKKFVTKNVNADLITIFDEK